MGDSGSAVSSLQQRLSELGYLDEKYVTGYYGEITCSAVRSFQSLAGLETDGVAGPLTMNKLESGSAPKKQKVVEKDWLTLSTAKPESKSKSAAWAEAIIWT